MKRFYGSFTKSPICGTGEEVGLQPEARAFSQLL
jgi:hypothetical protein